MMTTYYTHFESPVQPLLLVSNGEALTGLFMENHKHGPVDQEGWIQQDDLPLFTETKRQLAAYFDGKLRDFDLPLSSNGTPFQMRVWDELRKIGFGETITYGELAKRMGNPAAVRAVGLANGRNPISIIVPCHRVVGAGGKLTGYGGGLERKAMLLDLESVSERVDDKDSTRSGTKSLFTEVHSTR